ncbi:MAG: DUF1275 domain-containing protein [Lachnospiraceae bacterium]|nr:DUF1275 domain-containing protein [Lachnospiraceae bacterium]
MNKSANQMSESIWLGMVLALSGGFMDAYSYICRDEVFANAQTGNILLFGVNLVERNFTVALRYLCPVLAFTIGIIIADFIRFKVSPERQIHWRQIVVLIEAVILFGVAFIPRGYSLPANTLISLACGIQVESFRSIKGNGIATTMCIGNLRSGTQNLCEYIISKDKTYIRKCRLYYGIIFCFAIGAIIGSIFIKCINERAILICSLLLTVAFLMMYKGNNGSIE